VSGAVSQGDYKCASPLPSASDLGRLSPILVAQIIEIFDVTRLGEEDPLLTTFLSDCCFVGRPPPFPGEDIDDNYGLDFDDFDDDLVSSEQGQPLQLSLLGLPWSSRELSESELLMACIAEVDPASRALYAMEQHIRETGLDRNTLYREARSKGAILRDVDWTRAHMDNGSMVCTMNIARLLWYTTRVRHPPLKVADNH
jgi:hypothetical protein